MEKSKLGSGVIHLQRVDKYKLHQAQDLRKHMTVAEQKLWECLRRKQIAGVKFRRQQIIEGFIVDFFCHRVRLVIELDGGIHATEEQQKIDEHRRNVFRLRGLEEIRFNNEAVLNSLEDVVRQIHAEVHRRIGLV